MLKLILAVVITIAVCALLVLAFCLGIRHERKRRQALDEWLAEQQRESFEKLETALQGAGVIAPNLPTRDDIEREFLRQSDTANARPT